MAGATYLGLSFRVYTQVAGAVLRSSDDPLMAGGLYVGLSFRVYLQVAGAVFGPFDGRGEPSSGGSLRGDPHRPAHPLHFLWQPVSPTGTHLQHL